MSAPADRHVLTRAVEPSDIDELGHVNNGVYVRWVQEAAISHWGTDADPADQAALFWVVTRHEIDYLRAAMPGDGIVIETWVGKALGRDLSTSRTPENYYPATLRIMTVLAAQMRFPSCLR